MTTIEAYNFCMKVVGQLQMAGFNVVYESESDLDEIPEEAGELPKKFWTSINIKTKSKKKMAIVFEKEKEISDAGIYFDKGCGFGERNWCLDWSLSVF